MLMLGRVSVVKLVS